MYSVGDKITGEINSIDFTNKRIGIIIEDKVMLFKICLKYFEKNLIALKPGDYFEGRIIGKLRDELLQIGHIEFGNKPPKDNILNSYYQALTFFKNLLHEDFCKEMDIDLACECTSIVKGMINRCVRKDQSDWIIVYKAFRFPFDGEIYKYGSLVTNINRLLRQVKKEESSFESIEEELTKLLYDLRSSAFKIRLANAYSWTSTEILARGVKPQPIIISKDTDSEEVAAEINFENSMEAVNYKKLIKNATSFKEAVDLKNEMIRWGEEPDSKTYGIIINKAQSREEVDEIKQEMMEKGIEILTDTKRGKYQSFLNYAKSFNEANEIKEKVKKKGIVPPLEVYEILLKKAEKDEDINNIKNEMKILGFPCESYNKVSFEKLILNSTSLKKALDLKEEMEQAGVEPTEAVYNELLYKAIKYEDVEKFSMEKREKGFKANYIDYFNLIKKCKSFEKAIEIKHEMESSKIKADIKIYDALIKKSHDIVQALELVKEMENRGIAPDDTIYDYLILRAENQEQIELFVNLKEEFLNTKLELLAAKELETSIQEIYDTRDVEGIKLLLKEVEAGKYGEIEKNSLASSKIIGGYGKYMVFLQKVIEDIEAFIKKPSSASKIFNLNGKITALELESNNFHESLTAYSEDLKELKSEEDEELYANEIKYTESVIDGLKLKKSIYEEFYKRPAPIKIIAFFDDILLMEIQKLEARLYGFTECDKVNMNTMKGNSYHFTTSIKDFLDAVQSVDYDVFDVAINFILPNSCSDSASFFEQYPEEASNLKSLYKYRMRKFCHLHFIHKVDICKMLFVNLYKDTAFSSQLFVGQKRTLDK